jgi:pimeloyl-ACP methyl ester carboxylesterase
MLKKRNGTGNSSSGKRRLWYEGYGMSRDLKKFGVQRLTYRLTNLVEQRYISTRAFSEFREATGLADFTWRLFYSSHGWGRQVNSQQALAYAQGIVIFIHGWSGSGEIWEDLPAKVCQSNNRLVCLVPDVNGFGGSPFVEAEMPPVELCDPPACMRAVELWLELLKLRASSRRVFTFVGHSMGGAALFFKTRKGEGPHGLCAIAPALLSNDTLRQGFYTALGLGIGTGISYGFLDRFKDALAPKVVERLIAGASQKVKSEHQRIFASTAKGTIAQTFYAMGQLKHKPGNGSWPNIKVILGHSDRLVALLPTLSLMKELGVKSSDIRVVLGDHYLFSVGRDTLRTHGENTEIVLEEILALHDQCRAQAARNGSTLRGIGLKAITPAGLRGERKQ